MAKDVSERGERRTRAKNTCKWLFNVRAVISSTSASTRATTAATQTHNWCLTPLDWKWCEQGHGGHLLPIPGQGGEFKAVVTWRSWGEDGSQTAEEDGAHKNLDVSQVSHCYTFKVPRWITTPLLKLSWHAHIEISSKPQITDTFNLISLSTTIQPDVTQKSVLKACLPAEVCET